MARFRRVFFLPTAKQSFPVRSLVAVPLFLPLNKSYNKNKEMTLTVVVGSSGSGKTTFLNDVHKSHKCIYIRQYHNIRPYVAVTKIPNFDPTGLPYWDIYQREGKATTIKAGGTMAGEFTAGLSGGQRKLLLFELIYQRVRHQNDLLICLDEPFSGVTDDFVPFIVDRLNKLRQGHNILLVTNDHVQTLKEMADNTLTVSAIDRTTVKINDLEQVNREKAILALSVGDQYNYEASSADIKFFLDVEVLSNPALIGVGVFMLFAFTLFVLTFWDSHQSSGPLVIVAAGIIAFFSINPYLIALVDWRNFMNEEAEALLHASKGMNRLLKSVLTTSLIIIISVFEFVCVNVVIKGFESPKHWLAMLFDSTSLTVAHVCLGLFTELPFHLVAILAGMPFLFMIFFSTTFSPGAGLPVLKIFRYVYSRFYWWCMIPGVQDLMEGCPATPAANMVALAMSALIIPFVFITVLGTGHMMRSLKHKKKASKNEKLKDEEFRELQVALYGDRVLELEQTNRSSGSRVKSEKQSPRA